MIIVITCNVLVTCGNVSFTDMHSKFNKMYRVTSSYICVKIEIAHI